MFFQRKINLPAGRWLILALRAFKRPFVSLKQIIQSLRTGQTSLEEVPAPVVRPGHLLVQTTRSLVSRGTERMLVDFGRANWLQKVRQQPEKVAQVLRKAKAEGIFPTLRAVQNKLDQPLPLGYCNVGRVLAVGEGVTEFRVGDRVASNGPHAEFVVVPKNLAVSIPDEVSDEEATFTCVGAIGLQGIRLCNPTLGETFVVIGLGLIGLLTAELLLANGCRVIGIEPNPFKAELARKKGVLMMDSGSGASLVEGVLALTHGAGTDGVLITAAAQTNTIMAQAAQMSRKRGRIVLIGVVGLHLNRSDFYEKELSFQVSCSYGPGRYDATYEQGGNDYPLPFVRWTEKRNFATVLEAIRSGKLVVEPLITERVPLEDFSRIYDKMQGQESIASILEYREDAVPHTIIPVAPKISGNFAASGDGIGLIGAGNFSRMKLLPLLKSAGANLLSIASASGVSGTVLAKKYGIATSTTDYKTLLQDPAIALVLIATRHNQHAAMTAESLRAGKHVFVEKPLAIDAAGLAEILAAYNGQTTLNVGFNRRFSPHVVQMKVLLGSAPMNVIATMNAGAVSPDSWVQDMREGGGRMIGEACHHIDLITALTGSRVVAVCMNAMGKNPAANTDNASVLLQYENGSTGTIHYFSNGSADYPKERVEVYSQGRTLILDDFRVTQGYGFKGFSRLKTRQDKGHPAQFRLLIQRLRNGGPALIPFDEIINTTKASLAAIQSFQNQCWVTLS